MRGDLKLLNGMTPEYLRLLATVKNTIWVKVISTSWLKLESGFGKWSIRHKGKSGIFYHILLNYATGEKILNGLFLHWIPRLVTVKLVLYVV